MTRTPNLAVVGEFQDVTRCPYCGDIPDEQTPCCVTAELNSLRSLVRDLSRRVAFELEDPPNDEHARNFLLYLRQRLVR